LQVFLKNFVDLAVFDFFLNSKIVLCKRLVNRAQTEIVAEFISFNHPIAEKEAEKNLFTGIIYF
jgi:hypothetical protein